jgi:TOMM system kinase/cyclase fusion protein
MHYDPLIAVGDVFQERYRIQETLSTGGFAVVYKAEQLATGQSVAIKCIRHYGPTPEDDEKRVARFQREVRLCAQLHHPNIVRLIDSGWIDASMYAVFEYVPGKNLAQVLAEEGKLTPVEAGYLMGQVLDALSCAHDAGIIHRDLKPANIMIVPTGARRNATVLDFGIGGVLRESHGLDEKTLTRTFERMGTPAYSSPEQLRGRVLTPHTDIYSWGLVFLECLTGRRPIEGDTVAEVMHRQLDEAPVPIPRALKGHPLDELLRVATAKNVTNRRYTTRELLSRLDACPLAALDLSGEAGGAQAPEEFSTLAMGVTVMSAMAAEPRPAPEVTTGNMLGQRERRQLTVVSCTISVLSENGAALDLEEHEDRLVEEAAFCRSLGTSLGGHVLGGTEHRVLLGFGYPAASGEDARRAVHAALAIAREFAGRSAALQRAHKLRSAVHIGVHTGLVLVRQEGPAQAPPSFSGTAVRVASHIDAHAAANGVVVSQATYQLVRTQFALSPGAQVSVPGHAEPVEIFQLPDSPWDESADAPTYGDASAPLVGRDQEMDFLRRHWRMANEGRGQSVLVIGDAGIGKSRLVRELGRVLSSGAHPWLQGRCMPEARNSALQPVVDLLQRHLGFRPAMDEAERRRRLEELLDAHELERAQVMPLLAPVLGVPLGPAYAPLPLAPQRQRELTLRVLLSLFSDMATRQPMVLVIEDVHWADATTLALLALLVEEASAVSMLLLFTARPEAGGALAPAATLKLDRLDSENASNMIQRCAGGKTLPGVVVSEILRRTDGVPLFVEEMVRAVLGSGMLVEHEDHYRLKGVLADLEIPASLRELLLARLDRLGREVKAALQLGAVLGREFRSEELAAAGGYDGEVLGRLTDALVDSGLLYCRRRLSGEIFVFKHALVHDAAYDSMPRSTRAMYHRHIAHMLEERFPEVAEKRPELLARHHASGGQITAALGYSRRAALEALIKSANDEAIGHAQQAIAWLTDIEDEKQRAELELGFQAIIAPALFGTRGHGDREFGALARRSLRLISVVGDSPQVLPALWGVWVHHYVRSEFARALPLAENYLERAHRIGDSDGLVIGHSIVASTLFYLGRFADARASASESIAHYRPEAHRHHTMVVGYDTRSAQLGLRAMCAWMLGHVSEAVADAEAAADWSRTTEHPVTVCLSLFFLAHVRLWNGEPAAAERAAREILTIAERLGLDSWILLGEVLLGGATRDAARIRAVIGQFDEASQAIGRSYWYTLLAQAEVAAGEPDRALAAIDAARDFAERTGEHYFLAELHRHRSEVLAARPARPGASTEANPGAPGEATAEASLRRALEIARAQGARLPALLAATALCRWQASAGRLDAALLDEARALARDIGPAGAIPVLAAAHAVIAELGA